MKIEKYSMFFYCFPYIVKKKKINNNQGGISQAEEGYRADNEC